MDENDRRHPHVAPPTGDDEEFVRQLLERAGPRPPIPQQDLDAIAVSARSAWQWQLRRRARASARRAVWPLLTSLAAALALTAGLAWWSAANDQQPVTIARVEAVAGQVRFGEEATGSRLIAAAEELPAGALLSSGEGAAAGRAALRMAPGTIVRLDQGTRVRLVGARALRLERGALYVDTGAGAGSERQIEVWTPAGLVRDIGTRFSVRIPEQEGASVRVQVREGSVEVESGDRREVATVGQELSLRADGAAQRRDVSPFGSEWEWTLAAAAGFHIEGRSLAEFLDWVARETGWQIHFEDAELAAAAKRIRLHGGIGSLRPDQAPSAVLPGAGLEGKLEEGTLVIRRLRTPK